MILIASVIVPCAHFASLGGLRPSWQALLAGILDGDDGPGGKIAN
jgi:hypothetical protein